MSYFLRLFTTIISCVRHEGSFDVKTTLLSWETGSVSNSNLSNSAIPWFGVLFWHVTHTLPMDTEPVTRGNNVVLMSKLCHQTSPMPYSTENHSNCSCDHFICDIEWLSKSSVFLLFIENSEDKEKWTQKAWEDLVLKVSKMLDPSRMYIYFLLMIRCWEGRGYW